MAKFYQHLRLHARILFAVLKNISLSSVPPPPVLHCTYQAHLKPSPDRCNAQEQRVLTSQQDGCESLPNSHPVNLAQTHLGRVCK